MKVIEKKNLLPFCLVTSLFLLWGIANNMTDTLLSAFKKIMSMSDTQTSLIQFAFYGSYFCFALPAALYIKRRSYKSGIILGLILYAAGAILFMPAARAASYGFYLIAIYIMAGGCSILETTANPYILSMGSPETATRRLNVAQAFNPIGSITGILLSRFFILKDISLYSISGTYTALGTVLVFIMVIMLFSRMPGGRDTSEGNSLGTVFRRLLKNKRYTGGVIAQFFYIGAQIGVWSFTIRIAMQELGITEAKGATIYLCTIIGFSISRFIYTSLMKYIRPSLLLAFGGVASTCCALAVAFSAGSGWFLIIALGLVSFFMSLMFPTIYGIALEDISKGPHPDDAKIGASGLIMAILGGALVPPVQAMISDSAGIYTSYLIPAFCFVVVLLYALYIDRQERTEPF